VRALFEGVLAGLGIAVPVGPIAVLLVDLSTRRGFAHAVPAALGAASADLTYATVAAVLGTAAARALEPLETPLHVVSVVVLFAIAGVRTWRLVASRRAEAVRPASDRRSERGGARTYLAFLGLTLLNPVTVAYFAALILGLQDDTLTGPASKALFVLGAFGASAAWQLTLVGVSGLLHHRLPTNATLVTGLVGNAVILALAIRLLVGG
jgi:threonine/homoserine/homoserine lactone efflux protein